MFRQQDSTVHDQGLLSSAKEKNIPILALALRSLSGIPSMLEISNENEWQSIQGRLEEKT